MGLRKCGEDNFFLNGGIFNLWWFLLGLKMGGICWKDGEEMCQELLMLPLLFEYVVPLKI